METWSQWLTPVYIMSGWSLWPWWKDPDADQEGGEPAADEQSVPPDVTVDVTASPDSDVSLSETENGQFSLF
jgi:hypothetical protein